MAKKMTQKEMIADLRDRIRTEFAPGDRLPTTDQLVAHYGLSKASVAVVMNVLIATGEIVGKQGGGRYVPKPPPRRDK